MNLHDSSCSDSEAGDIKRAIMSKPAQIIDDIAQLAGGATGILGGAGQHLRDDIKARVEDMADRLNLVPRADLDRVEALLNKALAEQKELKQRLEKLESKQS